MRNNATLLFALIAASAIAAGCRQDMHDAPRYEAFEASASFADNRASRTPPTGTVARGWLREDEALYTGKVAGQPVETFPFAIAHALMDGAGAAISVLFPHLAQDGSQM